MGSDVDMPMMTPAQQIAAWLAPAMQRANFDTERGSGGRLAFANAVGVAPGTVTRWLQGKSTPDPDNFGAIAAALRVDPNEMLNDWGFISAKPVTQEQAAEVRSRPITPSQAAHDLGIDDPADRELFIAMVNRLAKRPGLTAAPVDEESAAAEG
ncbi:helix-turn-helix domain-containing protein [Streptacidiphilus cavernicola]|uniref:Helix-turn-helix domain-containing protein n=1 Tax=Streptacidiphilus cavernicola TaxID=3342716 RepID=A0ABV6W4P7_9ACTN